MTPRRTTAALLFTAAVAFGVGAFAGPPASQPANRPKPQISTAARQRVKNFTRPGWFVVDGHFIQPQAELSAGDLFSFAEAGDHFSLIARPSQRAEAVMTNYRTAVVKLAGSDFAWKLSCPGRIWNDAHDGGTQNLLLQAVTEGQRVGGDFRLAGVEITPFQQSASAVFADNGQGVQSTVVFGRDFIELTVGVPGAQPKVLVRSTSPRQLLADRPTEVRRYLVPLLQLIDHGENPLGPGAGDVYRVFSDLPIDQDADKALAAILPGLSDPEPAVRQRASGALRDLGRRGVQAAMRLDRSKLSPEAADRLDAWIAEASRDDRPVDVLLKDPNFILDCLRDADPNVRRAAGAKVNLFSGASSR